MDGLTRPASVRSLTTTNPPLFFFQLHSYYLVLALAFSSNYPATNQTTQISPTLSF